MALTTITIDDCTVYVLGEINRNEFKELINPSVDMDVGYSITKKVVHNVLERQLNQTGDQAMVSWLNANKDQVIYTVDMKMFSPRYSSTEAFEWGVTFAPGNSCESLFVLKWS